MENKPRRPQISIKEKERWDKAIAQQQKIANNPQSQQEAEEFAKEISSISVLESLRDFTI